MTKCHVINGHGGAIKSINFDDKGDLLISSSTDKKYFSIGSTKGEVYVFEVSTGELIEKIDNKSSAPISAVSWRPYHSQLYVGDTNGVLTVWT